jgi:SAM-dependent methyltransferase
MRGPDGKRYGSEWVLDDFDDYLDILLLSKFKQWSQSNDQTPITALDIGCGTGLRAKRLAKLGGFSEVIASDFADRSKYLATRNDFVKEATIATGKSPTPIRFLQSSVVKLKPEVLSGPPPKHINFRNVGHFLAPVDFRKALTTIFDLASGDAIVSVSFDKQNIFSDRVASIFDSSSIDSFYLVSEPDSAPYMSYDHLKVREFMQSIGFKIQNEPSFNFSDNVRACEDHIVAMVPANKLELRAQKVGCG